MIVPLYKGKGERTECKNCRGITWLSVYVGILVDRVCRVTKGLINGKQGGFRMGRDCVDQIFTLKQIVEKAQEKKMHSICGFYRFGEGVR